MFAPVSASHVGAKVCEMLVPENRSAVALGAKNDYAVSDVPSRVTLFIEIDFDFDTLSESWPTVNIAKVVGELRARRQQTTAATQL